MRLGLFLVLGTMLLSGCATQYKYEPTSPKDPKITFGDRFGGGSVLSPARNFLINTKGTNQCDDYHASGVLSNHWTGVGEKTRDYYVPVNQLVKIVGHYNYSNGFIQKACTIGPYSFTPVPEKHYSIDILEAGRVCKMSVVEILADGKHAKDEEFLELEEECTNE